MASPSVFCLGTGNDEGTDCWLKEVQAALLSGISDTGLQRVRVPLCHQKVNRSTHHAFTSLKLLHVHVFCTSKEYTTTLQNCMATKTKLL